MYTHYARHGVLEFRPLHDGIEMLFMPVTHASSLYTPYLNFLFCFFFGWFVVQMNVGIVDVNGAKVHKPSTE